MTTEGKVEYSPPDLVFDEFIPSPNSLSLDHIFHKLRGKSVRITVEPLDE